MFSVPRIIIAEKLSELYRYGFGQSPHSAVCIFGRKVAENLPDEDVSPKAYVQIWVTETKKFLNENSEVCIADYRDLSNAENNLIAIMWNVATAIVSKEFSDEAFLAFQDLLGSLLEAIPPKSISIN